MKYLSYNVNKSNLLRFLTPTSEGTQWYEPPPEGVDNKRLIGRLSLQFHQVAEIIYNENKCSNLKFLDIGTGSGILPELVSKFFSCSSCVGVDPYEDAEHITSHPRNIRAKILKQINFYLRKKYIDFSAYKNLINYESFSRIPSRIYSSKSKKKWKFEKKFVHQLPQNQKYNFIFAKSIDHIPEWNKLFKKISKISEKNCTLLIKLNSFFSYNGAHRYGSTFIPWGHVLLNEKEYKNYVKKFHLERSREIINFYYNGLSYPRYTIDDLKIILIKNNWEIISIDYSINKKANEMLKLAGGAKKLLKLAKNNFNNISLAELISNRILLKMKKI